MAGPRTSPARYGELVRDFMALATPPSAGAYARRVGVNEKVFRDKVKLARRSTPPPSTPPAPTGDTDSQGQITSLRAEVQATWAMVDKLIEKLAERGR